MTESKEEAKEEEGDEGLFDSIIESLQDQEEDISDKSAVITEDEETKFPTEKEIVDEALERLLNKRQDEIAEKKDNLETRKRKTNVSLEMADPERTIKEFEQILKELVEDGLKDYIMRNSTLVQKKASLEEKDEVFSYVVNENLEGYLVIGGANVIFENIFKELEENGRTVSKDEKKFIKNCYEESAKRNGHQRHLLLDNIIYIPV